LAGVGVKVESIIRGLERRGETLAVAESLTGGLLSATIVDVPGASKVFRGALIVYATDLKHTLAGVDAKLLAERGPVDPDVALALARGAASACGATWGLATTGVAGPDAQDGVPVGKVFIGLAGPVERVKELTLTGGRSEIRQTTVAEALSLLGETFPTQR
jgi:nicotinamide-nucleotide amidase